MQNVHRIPLGEHEAVVDRADAQLVAGFAWRLLTNGYVQAQRGKFYVYLHRLIAGAGPDERVDHENRDPLDNRTCNLRIATGSQNGANRGPDRRRLGTSSRFKGVYWDRRRKAWRTTIHVDGRTRYLGQYEAEEKAAAAYNRAAIETWGDFARLNDVREGSPAVGR